MKKHPLHPALVHFPIAFWVLAVVVDFGNVYWNHEQSWQLATLLFAIGCASALLAMSAGMIDMAKVPEGAALNDLYKHMGFILVAFSCFTVRLIIGQEHYQAIEPTMLAYLLDTIGVLSLIVGGWWGAQLVYDHGIGQTQHSEVHH